MYSKYLNFSEKWSKEDIIYSIYIFLKEIMNFKYLEFKDNANYKNIWLKVNSEMLKVLTIDSLKFLKRS